MEQNAAQSRAIHSTLQSVINRNREAFMQGRFATQKQIGQTNGSAYNTQQSQMQTQVDTNAREREEDIMSRNKTNMMAISADEVDRMLFKKGLASPTLLQTEKNEMMRRQWANRRVTEKTTTLTNLNAFVK